MYVLNVCFAGKQVANGCGFNKVDIMMRAQWIVARTGDEVG